MKKGLVVLSKGVDKKDMINTACCKAGAQQKI